MSVGYLHLGVLSDIDAFVLAIVTNLSQTKSHRDPYILWLMCHHADVTSRLQSFKIGADGKTAQFIDYAIALVSEAVETYSTFCHRHMTSIINGSEL